MISAISEGGRSYNNRMVLTPIALSFAADPKSELLLTYPDLQEILREVAKRPNVTSLNLQGNFIPRRCVSLLVNFISSNKTIRSIDLSQCGLGDDAAELLLRATTTARSPTSLLQSHLTAINLSHNYLTDRTCSYIRKIAPTTSLRQLTLNFNAITNKGLIAVLCIGSLYTALSFQYCLLTPVDSLVSLLTMRLKDSPSLRQMKLDGNGFKKGQYETLKKALEGRPIASSLTMGRAAGPLSAVKQMLDNFVEEERKKAEDEKSKEEEKQKDGEKNTESGTEDNDDAEKDQHSQQCRPVDSAVVDEIAKVAGKIVEVRKKENEDHITQLDKQSRTRRASRAHQLLEVENSQPVRNIRRYEDGDSEFQSEVRSRRSRSECDAAPNFRRERDEKKPKNDEQSSPPPKQQGRGTETAEDDSTSKKDETAAAKKKNEEDDGSKKDGQPAEKQGDDSKPKQTDSSTEAAKEDKKADDDDANSSAAPASEAKKEDEKAEEKGNAENNNAAAPQDGKEEEGEEEPFVTPIQPQIISSGRRSSRAPSSGSQCGDRSRSSMSGRSASVYSCGSRRASSTSRYVDPVDANPGGFGADKEPSVKMQLRRGKLARLLLDRAAACDDQALYILNMVDGSSLEAHGGVEVDCPDKLIHYSALPSHLHGMSCHSADRIHGLAKLLFMILYAPGERVPVDKVVKMQDMPTTVRNAPSMDQARYRSSRSVENNSARKLLASLIGEEELAYGGGTSTSPARSASGSRARSRETSTMSSSPVAARTPSARPPSSAARGREAIMARARPRYLDHYRTERAERMLHPPSHSYRAQSAAARRKQ